MLKACWDCIAGDQQGRNEEPHSVHLNGIQGPPWQTLSNGNMFPTPALRAGNQIIIKGQLTNDRRLNLTIATSYNTVCEIKVANRPNNNEAEDFVEIITQRGVAYKDSAYALYNEGIDYIFRFEVDGDGSSFDVYAGTEEGAGDQYLETVAADVNNIKSISASGQVEKLIFIFK